MSRYRDLSVRIAEVYGSQANFAKAIGISSQLLSSKLNDKCSWKSNEMEMAIKLLNIKRSEIPDLFFPLT